MRRRDGEGLRGPTVSHNKKERYTRSMERGTFSRAFLNAMVQIYAPFLSLLIVEERVAAAGRERNVQTVQSADR